MLKKIKRLKKENEVFKSYTGFLKTVNIDNDIEKKDNYNIGILLTPWVVSTVSLYAITIGLLLKSRGYNNITFVINDLWNKKNSFYSNYQMQVKATFKILKNKHLSELQFSILKLSDFPIVPLDDEDQKIISHYANLNTIRYLGNSIADQEHETIYRTWMTIYNNMCGHIKGCSEMNWDRFVLPAGMFQETGVFLEFFKKKNINILTYDSSLGRYAIGINVCASQNDNVKETADYIMQNKQNLKIIEKTAKGIMLNRMQRRLELGVVEPGKIIQNIAYEEGANPKYDIVIFTNVEFDTAALGTHDVFESDYTWITETIQFILDNTDATVAVRQHPLQRQFTYMTTNEERLQEKFKGKERVTFIHYDAKINSYNLIENAKVIIVNTSTVGLEAGMLGKNVITDSHSYYHSAEFVKYCNKKEQYFDTIIKMFNNRNEVAEDNRTEAAVYYFLTQKCSSVLTDFTPQPTDFEHWSKRKFGDLTSDKTIDYLLKAIIELKPVDRQVYEDMFRKGNFPE